MADEWAQYARKPEPTDEWSQFARPAGGASIPGMEQLGGAAPPPAAPPSALPKPNALRASTQPNTVSVPMFGRNNEILSDKGSDVPMGPTARIATAPLRKGKALLEDSGRNVVTGAHRIANAKPNPIGLPTSEFLGGLSDIATGVGEAALPFGLTNPKALAKGLAVGIPTGEVVQGAAEKLGVPEGTSQFLGTVTGGVAGGKAATSSVRGGLNRLGVPEALERSAGRSYRKMLTPSAKDLVPEAERIAGGPSPNGPTGLVGARPVALTREGMMKKADLTTKSIGPVAKNAYETKPPVDPNPILEYLDSLKREKAVVKGTEVVSDPTLASAIDELKLNIEDMRGKDGRVSASALDDYKDKLNRGNVSPRGFMRQVAPQTAADIEKSVANKIMGYLDEAYPDAAAVNKAYSTAKGTKNFLEQQRRAEIVAESGVRTGSSTGAGAAIKKVIPAPLRHIPTAIAALFDSVAWDSTNGAVKAKIAQLIRQGAHKQAAQELSKLPQLPQLSAGHAQEIIPRFAKGGIIRKPTLGIVGEAGPEAIVPVETLRRSVRGRKTLESLPSPDAYERTSAKATVPEERGTLKEQLEQLAAGERRVVMFPRGTNLMRRPDGMKEYRDADKNSYIFNPALASTKDIDAAIENNTLPDLLGATDGGMGVPDKSKLGAAVNVVAKKSDGKAVQSAAADSKSLPRAVAQAKKVTPKGGKVAVEDPAKEIQRRLK
jgi:hypothetical protein